MENTRLLLIILAYIGAARACLSLRTDDKWRPLLFSLTNLAFIGIMFSESTGKRRAVVFLSVYLALVGVHYLVMTLFSKREGWLPWLAFFSPIIALVLIKYLPFVWEAPLKSIDLKADGFVGISYMSLRLSYLVLEVRNRVVEKPTFWQYVGFSFFLPTFVVGPINPYRMHERSFRRTDREGISTGRSAMRIIVGVAKYQVLAPLFNQLSYSGLLLDSYPHPPSDLVVAAVSYYLFLYCNFAGFCDMAIGVAGLLGIHVRENFQNPLAARNVRDFWNRWHITLSDYMRDVVFTPLSKFFIGRFGIPTNHAIGLAILAVFLLVGIWHGVGWNYLAFGAMHAVGVAANHYYTVWLKSHGGKRFKAYNENPAVNVVSVVLTFSFVTASFFLFANDFATMRTILNAIRW
ncbi:MAG: hypothetical protein H0T77_02020 [Pyrinomonadaceae bacterium]|nr:hypothetical protein [Pyrinomonadaceae bacterium]